MRHLVAAFATAVLVTGGTTIGSAAFASAGPTDGPEFTSPWRMTCAGYLVGNPDQDTRAHIRADVDAPDTTRDPTGFLEVQVRRYDGRDGDSGRFFTRGGHVDLYLGPLRPGRYFGSVQYKPRSIHSLFSPCSDGFRFTVERAASSD